jgi:uncharacterized membrane protein
MKKKFFWLLFLLLTFIVTLPISWWGLAKADFFYSSLYDSIGIGEHIERYAPGNQKSKPGFENTSKAERVALFHDIVTAIHNQGKGLESLSYLNQGQQVALLSTAEVTHLRDVAILLEKLRPVLIVAIIIWLLSLIIIFIKHIEIPSAKQFLLSAFSLLIICAIVLSFGPEKLFNQLHIWAFPKDHQWFFYYEESLMSTMMKAPDLFAYISAIWVLISIIISTVFIKVLYLIEGSRRNRYS